MSAKVWAENRLGLITTQDCSEGWSYEQSPGELEKEGHAHLAEALLIRGSCVERLLWHLLETYLRLLGLSGGNQFIQHTNKCLSFIQSEHLRLLIFYKFSLFDGMKE